MKVVATQYIAAGEAVVVDQGLARPAFASETGGRRSILVTALEDIQKGTTAVVDAGLRTIKRAAYRR